MPAYLLVLPLTEAETKTGLILDVKTVRSINPNTKAIVKGVGSPTKNYPMNEFTRDGNEMVLIPRGAGTEVERDGDKLRLVHVSEVICMWPGREKGEWKTQEDASDV